MEIGGTERGTENKGNGPAEREREPKRGEMGMGMQEGSRLDWRGVRTFTRFVPSPFFPYSNFFYISEFDDDFFICEWVQQG